MNKNKEREEKRECGGKTQGEKEKKAGVSRVFFKITKKPLGDYIKKMKMTFYIITPSYLIS